MKNAPGFERPLGRGGAGLWLACVGALAMACAPTEPLAPSGAVTQARSFEIRPTELHLDPLWHYDPDDDIEHFDSASGDFRVHFTRAGRHRVPLNDADVSGTPDYVELVARIYDDVLLRYVELGFRPPLDDAVMPGDNGGDDRFDVYLIDFARQSDGAFGADACLQSNSDACAGHIVQENDFAGYSYPSLEIATRTLASHEFFHAIQAGYDHDQDVVISEGTAVWASAMYDADLGDLEGFIYGYLEDPSRSIDVPPPGPVPRFAYGSALFFRFLEERYAPEVIRELWEHLENGHGLDGEGANPADPGWMTQLDLLLQAQYASSFAEAYADFARWNLYTDRAADPDEAYADGARYPRVTMEPVDPPFEEDRLRVYHASAQYFDVAIVNRNEMTAALLPHPDRPDALDDLVLLLAVQRDRRWQIATQVDDISAGTQAVDTAHANRFVVVVVNTARTGSSRKPSLCAGTPDEVAACRSNLLPEADGGVSDAGPPDAETEPDTQVDSVSDVGGPSDDAEPDENPDAGVTPNADAGDPPDSGDDDDGGCTAFLAARSSAGWLWGVCLGLLAVGRRRSRQGPH